MELLPAVPPPGDITWLGELPCAGPSVCLCHIPFVMLTIGDSHNNGLLLYFFVFFLDFSQMCWSWESLSFIVEQGATVFECL